MDYDCPDKECCRRYLVEKLREHFRQQDVLSALQRCCEKYPDLRLGQLMEIVGSNSKDGKPTGADLFSVSDAELIKRLDDFR